MDMLSVNALRPWRAASALALAIGLVILVPSGAGASTPWSVVASPNAGTGNNILSGVSCVSTTSCVSVGIATTATKIDRTLIESWNGTTWAHAASPNVGTNHNDLDAVSCVPGSTFCAAVGAFFLPGTHGAPRPLAEVRRGATWSSVPTQGIGVASGFNGVSCASPTRCIAVGMYLNGAGAWNTLVEIWNGSSWGRLTSPNVGTVGGELDAVSCAGATRCVAVGDYETTAQVDRTLVEVWNGVTWTRVASPNVGTTANDLVGVSCVAATRCIAVGAVSTASKVLRTLVEVWDGTAWVRVASVNVGTRNNVLFSVSCVSTSSCTAVGEYRNVANIRRSLIETWDGARWSQVPAPNIGTGENVLESAACVKGTTICKAVGFYTASSRVSRTLAGSSS